VSVPKNKIMPGSQLYDNIVQLKPNAKELGNRLLRIGDGEGDEE